MSFLIKLVLFSSCAIAGLCTLSADLSADVPPEKILYYQISDNNWEEIQKGQWLIGIFHQDSSQSVALEKDWNIFALKCKEYDIKVGMIKAHENPELQVRFLAKEFPKVFHIEEGAVRIFPIPTRDELVRIIKDKRWEELESVSKFSNPFSTHLSLFSYLCSRALLLYNFEKHFISDYSTSPNVVNAVFGLTFVLLGTALGLVFSCLFQLVKFFVYCCLCKTHPDYPPEEFPLPLEESPPKVTQSGQAKTNKVSKKYNSLKGKMKLRKRKT